MLCGCSIGGAPGVGAFSGLATNVTMLKTEFPTRGLNGTAVNVRLLDLSVHARLTRHCMVSTMPWQ